MVPMHNTRNEPITHYSSQQTNRREETVMYVFQLISGWDWLAWPEPDVRPALPEYEMTNTKNTEISLRSSVNSNLFGAVVEFSLCAAASIIA